MQDRTAELLDVPYFHLVFTLPEPIAAVALQNPRLVYGMLFRAASQTLLEVAANPKHLGAKIGFLAVLHTWGQNLHHHPHLHCVVPGGGISPDGSKWIAAKKDFFLPVRVLSRVFRGKFIALLKQAHERGKLHLQGQLAHLRENGPWQQWLNEAVRKEWVVYAKPPFGGPQVVLKYLARYTHRVAISNRRLLRMQDGQVTFRVKDYAAGGRRTLTLSAVEFLRRFLQHVLPRGFMRIRHFGFMANRFRQEQLARCRELLGMQPSELAEAPETPPAEQPILPAQDLADVTCPACGRGRLHVELLQRVDPPQALVPPRFSLRPQLCDSS
jgi:hypothetical protein